MDILKEMTAIIFMAMLLKKNKEAFELYLK